MKILILTRHFPPEISGGVKRWFWLADELFSRNHDITIIAPDLEQNEHLENHHSARIIRIPHKSAINGAKKANPNQATPNEPRHKSFLREMFLLPDPDITWVKLLIKQLPRLLEGENFDWIITSSPPESLHYAGYKLKGVLANHWHADMRDYWLKYPLIDIRNNHIRRARESRIAKKWLKRADLRTAVDSGMASEMESLSGCQTRILPHFSLPNFESKTSVNFEGPVKSVRLVYTGSFTLSDSNRHIEPMLQTYEKAFKTRKNLTLHIFGRLTQHEVQAIKTSRASSSIFFYGAVSAEKALSAQKNADALVITASKKASAVPGKLMEYRHTNKPIIAIGDGPWLSANPDIKQGEEAMILASKKELPVSNVKTINLQGVCDTLIKFLRDENSNNHPL